MDTSDEIFEVARDLPRDQRSRYLRDVCRDATERDRLEALLHDADKAEEFFDSLVESERIEDSPEGAGTVIGPYTLREPLGEGGFGTVFLAEQTEPIAREVAVKVIKLGMDTEDVIARFEAERRALAMMDHSGIAKVLDAGSTPAGRPCFVMELVDGVRITQFCDEHRLGTEARLNLYMEVCRAVQHAHQKGIIHRDLKPSNILVATEEGKPLPKVIDFGIATATDARASERGFETLFTRFELFLGTPVYMSPEQVSRGRQDIDTRSDIYSLGVLLYELLTGKTPFDPKELVESGHDEMRRIIQEEEPPKPSAQLARLDADEREALTRSHGERPEKIAGQLRGDLEWIVLKAIEKDRSRRYATANALRLDLQRFLENEPVSAVSPSKFYRFRKFARRNKGPFVASALITASLVTGMAMNTILSSLRARTSEEKAKTAKAAEDAAEDVAKQNERRARTEIGNVWMERANYYQARDGETFLAAPMTALAIGFDGLGRQGQPEEFKESFPVWFEPGTPDHQRAQEIALENAKAPRPLWSSPAASHHLGAVEALAYSHDGRTLATAGREGSIKLWNVETGRNTQLFRANGPAVNVLAFSPDGGTLACACDDFSIELWQVATGERRATLVGHQGRIASVAFHPDGQTLATGGCDNAIIFWDMETGRKLETLAEQAFRILTISFGPHGKSLTIVSRRGAVRKWDLANDSVETLLPSGDWSGTLAELASNAKTLVRASGDRIDVQDLSGLVGQGYTRSSAETCINLGSGNKRVHTLAISAEGRRIATYGWDRIVTIWELDPNAKPRVLAELASRRSVPSGLAFAPDGQTLAIGYGNGTINQWNPRDGEQRFAPTGHLARVRQVAYGSEGRLLASMSDDGAVRIWDLVNGAHLRPFDNGSCIALSPDSERLAVATGKDVSVWNLASDEPPEVLRGGKGDFAVDFLAFGPLGQKLVGAGNRGGLIAWDLGSGERVRQHEGLSGGRSHVNAHALSPDGRILAGGGSGVRLWNLDDGSQHASFASGDSGVLTLAFSPDGKALAGGCEDGTVRVWSLPDRPDEPKILDGHGGAVRSVSFSPDGAHLVSAGESGTLMLWDVRGDEEPRMLWRSHRGFFDVAFSPDGRTLATGGGDKTVKLWDLTSTQSQGILARQSDEFRCYALSPDGATLATATAWGRIELWDLVNGGAPRAFRGYPTPVHSLAFGPEGKTLAGGGRGLRAWLWNLEQGGEPQLLTVPRSQRDQSKATIREMVFSPDGRWLGGIGGSAAYVWELGSGGEVHVLDADDRREVEAIAFHPDGKRLATAEGRLFLWKLDELEKGGEPRRLAGERLGLQSLAFSPLNGLLAGGSSDGTIRLWNPNGSANPEILARQRGPVVSLAFRPDGGMLASSAETITLWDLAGKREPIAIPGSGPLAFDATGRLLAGRDRDGVIVPWNLESIRASTVSNLAGYLTDRWFAVNGREVVWLPTTDRLDEEKRFGFLNVPRESDLAMHQRGASPRVLFAQFSRARNWDAALASYRRLEAGGSQASAAAEELVRWFETDLERGSLAPELADLRFGQLEDLLAVFPPAFAGRERFRAVSDRRNLLAAGPQLEAPRSDLPMWGGTVSRNMAAVAENLPVDIDPGKMDRRTGTIDMSTTKNVRWISKLGSSSFYFPPAVAHGKVFKGTNNECPRDPHILGDRGVLMCFDEQTGKFLWQLIVPKLGARKVSDWEYVGINSTPTVEEDRLWVVTNRGEVVCLDIDGLADGNDGPFKDEVEFMTDTNVGPDREVMVPTLTDQHADILWVFDMRDADTGVGSFPHNASATSPLVIGDILYVATSNGVDWSHTNIPAPYVPGLIALDKNTGELLGEEISGVSERSLHANWSSPAMGRANGRDILLWGGGDGFLYGFDPTPVFDEEERLAVLKELWRYDANPRHYRFEPDGAPVKYATYRGPSETGNAVYHDGLAYVAIGQDPEHGDGVGMLSCVDPSLRGELSGQDAVWTYAGIGRTLSTPSIADGLIYMAEYDGDLHCLDAKTGEVYWIHETGSRVWASTLVADGKVFLGTEDGAVIILKAGREKKHLATIKFHAPIYGNPVVANDTLYVSTQTHLYAISKED